MNAGLTTGLVALGVAFLTGAFAYVTSRKTSDDSRAIGLINAGQVALERALERATQELLDTRQQLAEVRAELAGVRQHLERVLAAHSECEDIRREQSRELLRLRRDQEKRDA